MDTGGRRVAPDNTSLFVKLSNNPTRASSQSAEALDNFDLNFMFADHFCKEPQQNPNYHQVPKSDHKYTIHPNHSVPDYPD